ncbi:MAG: hypothetical protein OQL16_02945 [Gammaproteobacteria bacterium]|nr:hypothetical protein [Gammaproteobacteria bacterium]
MYKEIHEDYSGLPALRPPGQLTLFKIASCDFVEHGAYVPDVRYAGFAGAKTGDAAIAEKDN